MEKIHEHDITNKLYRLYYGIKPQKFCVANTYIYYWESDFFFITKSDYATEIEVKTNRSDYFADFNKSQKHDVLQTGQTNIGDEEKPWIRNRRRPNKFYYCVPENLISVDEIPDYAGLMYFYNDYRGIRTIKPAPFLHKKKHDFTRSLLKKFSFKYHTLRINRYAQSRLDL